MADPIFRNWFNNPPTTGAAVPGTPNQPQPKFSFPIDPNNPRTPSLGVPASPTNDDDVNAFINDIATQQAATTTPGGEDDFTNPSKLPSSPPPTGHEWEWDTGMMRWQPKKITSKGKNVTIETDYVGNIWEVETDEKGNTFKHRIWSPPQGPTEQDKFDYEKEQDRVKAEQEKRDREYQAEQDRIENERKNKQISDAEAARQAEAARLEKERQDRLAQDEADRKEREKRAAEDETERQRVEADRQRQWDLSNRTFEWSQSQANQKAAAEKQSRLAALRAAPQSWLQWNLEANQTPVIQPWQKPLMPQQYGNLDVGAPIPGWTGLNQGQSSLPELTAPSTQYFARMGPTAQQQWGGYQQMQSGAPPEESYWRLQQSSAPGGRNQALSWLK